MITNEVRMLTATKIREQKGKLGLEEKGNKDDNIHK